MSLNNRSRSTLFLMEQLIVIAVFAICAAICVTILSESYLMAEKSIAKGNALHVAESAAECFKAASGDIQKAVATLGGASGSPSILYDKNWQICGEDGAVYILALSDFKPAWPVPRAVTLCKVSVSEYGGGELISLTAAAMKE